MENKAESKMVMGIIVVFINNNNKKGGVGKNLDQTTLKIS